MSDNMDSYSYLEDAGYVENFSSQDISAVLGFEDRELDDAIESLNTSTSAIRKHTEILKQQQDALNRLVKAQNKSGEIRSTLEASQLYTWSAECKTLSSKV